MIYRYRLKTDKIKVFSIGSPPASFGPIGMMNGNKYLACSGVTFEVQAQIKVKSTTLLSYSKTSRYLDVKKL